eukprot:gene2223-2428_t
MLEGEGMMEMDERKRTLEGGMGEAPLPFGGQPKRSRPEDNMGGFREDPTKATTRLLLNRNQFSRIIGKGGATIAHVRSATGVYMKGTDVDEEYRLVAMNGPLEQVLAAFDMIMELLYQSLVNGEGGASQGRNPDVLVVHLLLEHNKAGRAVGAKGMMIQTIKMKSGALAIRIEKEPLEIHGTSLRKLTIEGSLNAVRRAHLLVQELYIEPLPMANAAGYPNMPPGSGSIDPSAFHRPSYTGGPTPFDPMMGAPNQHSGPLDANGPLLHPVSVPFPSLTSFGVQQETVRQLTEMKAYLWRHFGLDLTISREMSSPQAISHAAMAAGVPMGRLPDAQPYPTPYGGGGVVNQRPMQPQNQRSGDGSGSRRPSHSSPSDVTFTIPKSCVGGVIGKGGQHLKDLQAEYGVRVYIEKDDVGGRRTVVLSYIGGDEAGLPEEEAISRCREHIEGVIADQLAKQKQDAQNSGDQITE